jgi:four helix bundle protein
MNNFKKLKIWQKGFEIAKSSFKFVSTFPKEERFGLVSQINRAAVSIAANIAEGTSRKSKKEFSHFLDISIGSAFELETYILLCGEIDYGDKTLAADMLSAIDEEQKMLFGFKSSLFKYLEAN